MSSPSSLSAVSETALLTLRARADEHRHPQRFFADPRAAEWSAALPWPATLDRAYDRFTQAKTALRAHQFDVIVRDVLARAPADACVVELGGGFSTRAERLDAASRWHLVDLPPVIEARRALGDRGALVGASVLDPGLLDALPPGPVVWVIEGLLYYLPRAPVDALLDALAARWPGSAVVLDVIGARDFGPAVKVSTRLGAPIQWHVEPPFAAAQAALGLSGDAAWTEARVLAETVDGFARRLGPLVGAGLAAAIKVPFLRERRSGIMVGHLGASGPGTTRASKN